MAKKYDTAYLDWDGVLWDFKQAYCDWIGRDVPDTDKWEFYEALGMSDSMFQGSLSGLPREFWDQDRYILPHAHDLVAWARANAENVFILTVAPEWECSKAKQFLANAEFGLEIYTVSKAEEKVAYAKKGCLLIDDKPSTVFRFANEVKGGVGGYVWPAKYNQGLDHLWYFKKSDMHKHKAHWALTDSDRSDILKDMKAEKPKLDYEAMDEAERRKKTPMYSGLLAYFPDALALVARNSMIGHYQHNDPKDPMYWDRSKSADEMDAMIRHMTDHSKDPYDTDGTLHMSKVCWRALAFVQKLIEEQNSEV